jgi:anti-sigma regulatory factor (Ser/Thr protein kinase)
VARYGQLLGSRRLHDAQLLVTELLTNAVVHGRGRIELAIEVHEDDVRFEVRDDGGHGVAASPSAHGAGWGLKLVAGLSDRWGTCGPGTRVWFEIARP